MLTIALLGGGLSFTYWLIICALLRQMSNQRREHARREDLLLNQMLNLAGKPWQPSPAASEQLDEWRRRLEDAREERRAWTTSPEQGL